MNTASLLEFPILAEETELAEGFILQRRVSGCGTKAALTIKMGETVAWFDRVDSAKYGLAEFVPRVKATLAGRVVDSSPGAQQLEVMRWDRDVIVANTAAETRALAELQIAARADGSAEAVARARAMIKETRAKIARHREVMKFAEQQIIRSEERIVLSRLKVAVSGHNGNHSNGEMAKATEREIRDLVEQQAAVREEGLAIREAERAMQDSINALPDA